MRLVSLLSLLSLAPLLCSAQTVQVPASGSARDITSIVAVQAPNGQGCPVGFQARHAGSGGLVQTSPGHSLHGQGFQFTLTSRNGAGISQAKVIMHGMSGAHVLPAGRQSYPDATESFSLSSSTATNPHLFRSTVYTEKLTGVQWIELNELTYADGTHWQESATTPCRITPNGFMLVAANK